MVANSPTDNSEPTEVKIRILFVILLIPELPFLKTKI